MGRSSDARDRLVATGRALFYARSIDSVGVAEVCSEAGVRKGSFYYFFQSKVALAVAALNAYWSDEQVLWKGILGGPRTALERVAALLDGLEARQDDVRQRFGCCLGCFIGNTVAESSLADLARAQARDILGRQIAMLATLLDQARSEGELPAERDPAQMAHDTVAYMQGQLLLARSMDDPSVLRSAGTRWASRLR